MTAPKNRIGTNLFSPVGPKTPLKTPTLLIALTDEAGLAMVSECIGTPPTTAGVFAHGSIVYQKDSALNANSVFQNIGSSASPSWSLMGTGSSGGNANSLIDSNNVAAVTVGTTASAVNNVQATNAIATKSPDLAAVGTDTNIGLTVTPKGTGVFSIQGPSTAKLGINYIGSETGANNAIVAALLDANGVAVPLASGLRVIVKLSHSLQAGANTFNFNGSGVKNIRKHTNSASTLTTAYANTGIIDLVYDGTEWLDMSQ